MLKASIKPEEQASMRIDLLLVVLGFVAGAAAIWTMGDRGGPDLRDSLAARLRWIGVLITVSFSTAVSIHLVRGALSLQRELFVWRCRTYQVDLFFLRSAAGVEGVHR